MITLHFYIKFYIHVHVHVRVCTVHVYCLVCVLGNPISVMNSTPSYASVMSLTQIAVTQLCVHIVHPHLPQAHVHRPTGVVSTAQ